MEQWLKFFIVGVIETATSSINTFKKILTLKEQILLKLKDLGKRQANAQKLLFFLFSKPVINYKEVEILLNITAPTANKLIKKFEELDVLEEMTGYQRNRIYCFKPYLKLF